MDIDNCEIISASKFLIPFWQHWKIYPKQTCCHLFGVYEFTYKIDISKLQKAIKILVDKNYNLRANFFEENSSLKMAIKSSSTQELKFYQTKNIVERNFLISTLFSKPFDLVNDELFRFHIITCLETKKDTLLIVYHHIILDGTNFNDMLNQLVSYYHDKPISNYTYNKELKIYMEHEKLNISQSNIDFWVNIIKYYPKQEILNFIDTRICLASQKTATQAFSLSKKETRAIEKFTQEKGITIFILIKMIWTTLIAQYCKKDKFVVVYPVSVRTKSFKDLIGSYINVLPYGLDLNATIQEQIKLEKNQLENYRKNRFAPTQNIIEKLSQLIPNKEVEGFFQVVVAQTDLRNAPPVFDTKQRHNSSQYKLTPNLGTAKILLEYQLIAGNIYYHINYLSPAISDMTAKELGVSLKNLLINALKDQSQKLINIAYTTCNSMPAIVDNSFIFRQHLGAKWHL